VRRDEGKSSGREWGEEAGIFVHGFTVHSYGLFFLPMPLSVQKKILKEI